MQAYMIGFAITFFLDILLFNVTGEHRSNNLRFYLICYSVLGVLIAYSTGDYIQITQLVLGMLSAKVVTQYLFNQGN